MTVVCGMTQPTVGYLEWSLVDVAWLLSSFIIIAGAIVGMQLSQRVAESAAVTRNGPVRHA